MSEHKVSPAPILQMATGYWASSILLTANRLGLFSSISGGVTVITAIAENLGLATYPLEGFLNALVSLGYLEKHGDSYSNTPISEAFLVEGRPGYLGAANRRSRTTRSSGIILKKQSILCWECTTGRSGSGSR
jgi:hypothetical protein